MKGFSNLLKKGWKGAISLFEMRRSPWAAGKVIHQETQQIYKYNTSLHNHISVYAEKTAEVESTEYVYKGRAINFDNFICFTYKCFFKYSWLPRLQIHWYSVPSRSCLPCYNFALKDTAA